MNGIGTLPTGINWIYFGKDENENNLITTSAPLGGNDKVSFIFNAKNWLSYETTLNTACANVYSKYGGTTGVARSITLDDINNATGFTKPNFKTYKFITGTVNNYANSEVNYYYPSIDAASNTYPYFKKTAQNETPTEFQSDNYNYYYDDKSNKYKLSYFENIYTIVDLELEKPNNIKYVVGDNTNYMYWVATRSVSVSSRGASFGVAGVGNRNISSNFNTFCTGRQNDGYTGTSATLDIRPLVVLPSNIKIKKQ